MGLASKLLCSYPVASFYLFTWELRLLLFDEELAKQDNTTRQTK